MNDLGQDIIADVEYVEQKTENIVENVINWKPWETILHLAFAVLFAYVAYMFVVSPQQRSLTN